STRDAVVRAPGVPEEYLRIVLLRDTQTREAHAVLSARNDGQWYILDNRRLGFYVYDELPHYMPLFALDHDGVKLFAAPYPMRSLKQGNDTVASAGPELEG